MARSALHTVPQLLVDAVTVVPSDTVRLPFTATRLYVGTVGDVRVKLSSGSIITFENMQGWSDPVQIEQVMDSGTDAGNIIALLDITATQRPVGEKQYIWTISNANFAAFNESASPPPAGDDGTALTGSFTFIRNGSGGYTVSAYAIQTVLGTSNIIGASYEIDDGGSAFTNDGLISSTSFTDTEGNYQLDIFWATDALLNAMNSNIDGAIVGLIPLTDSGGGVFTGTVETDYTVIDSLRYLDTGAIITLNVAPLD